MYAMDIWDEHWWCSSNCMIPENIYIHPKKGHCKFRGGGGSQKPKFLKENMKLNWNFEEVGGSERPWAVWILYRFHDLIVNLQQSQKVCIMIMIYDDHWQITKNYLASLPLPLPLTNHNIILLNFIQRIQDLSCPDENPERLKVLDISNFFTLQTVENYINLEENVTNVHLLRFIKNVIFHPLYHF